MTGLAQYLAAVVAGDGLGSRVEKCDQSAAIYRENADVDANAELPGSAQDAQEEESADEESAAGAPGEDDRDS